MKKSCYLIICFFFINSFILNAQRICGSAINDKAMSKQYREYRVMSRIGAHKMKNEIDKLPDKIIIPVVVHVIHKGEPIGVGYNISDEQIKSQIDVLNEDFNRQNADKVNTPPIFKNIAARIGIEFKLANIDPNGSPTNGIIRKKGVLDKYSHQVDNVKTERYGDISWDTKNI